MRAFIPHHRQYTLPPFRSGFTLVEMLVASALVVMLMAIFAQVFQLASGSMTLQRAIAENDQQVRTAVTVLRGDLQKRTFRQLTPFYPRENFEDPSATSFSSREGYFYISLNDLNNSSDNVLQFTVRSSIKSESLDETPFYGRATVLTPGATTATEKEKYFRIHSNQPAADDGQIERDSASSSTAAQVAYFVRNGILYRRVVLLREPLAIGATGATTSLIQPTTSATPPVDFFTPPTGPNPYLYPATANIWNDYDFSIVASPFPPPMGVSSSVIFLGIDATRNDLDNRRFDTPFSLGRTQLRWGFDQVNGLPREFFGSTNELFLGRFTHQETSDPDFKFPWDPTGASLAPGGNPFATTSALLDTVPDFQDIPDGLHDGSRVGEDVLLTNVHSFEIELYDPFVGDFRPVGYGTSTDPVSAQGHFHINRQLNSTFLSPTSTNSVAHVFDTWHPWFDRTGGSHAPPASHAAAMTQHFPPYRPLTYDPTGVSGPVPPTNAGNSPHWKPDADYNVGDIVFPPTEDINYNGRLDNNEDGSVPGYFLGPPTNPPRIDDLDPSNSSGTKLLVSRFSRNFYYRCVKKADAGYTYYAFTNPTADYTNQPLWGTTPGSTIYHSKVGPVPNDFPTRAAQWQVVSNLAPVSSIRITIRFQHPASGKLRQLTLIHSLEDQ